MCWVSLCHYQRHPTHRHTLSFTSREADCSWGGITKPEVQQLGVGLTQPARNVTSLQTTVTQVLKLINTLRLKGRTAQEDGGRTHLKHAYCALPLCHMTSPLCHMTSLAAAFTHLSVTSFTWRRNTWATASDHMTELEVQYHHWEWNCALDI